MNPLVVAVLSVCAVGITVALVAVLISLKRLIDRTESVMTLVEREIRPTASQLGALAEELRGVSHQVTRELERISMVTRRAGGRITEVIAKVVGRWAGSPGSAGSPAWRWVCSGGWTSSSRGSSIGSRKDHRQLQ